MFRGCLPSWYCIPDGSLSPSFRALGFSNFASYFKLPSWCLPIFIWPGLTAFLCLVDSSISGAYGGTSAKFTQWFPFPPGPTAIVLHWRGREIVCIWGFGGNADGCRCQAWPLEWIQWGGSMLCRSLRLEGLVEAQNRRTLVEKELLQTAV